MINGGSKVHYLISASALTLGGVHSHDILSLCGFDTGRNILCNKQTRVGTEVSISSLNSSRLHVLKNSIDFRRVADQWCFVPRN